MTQDELLWYFDYDRERGVLVWKNHWRKEIATRVVGKVAGTFDTKDYRVVRLHGKGIKIHQIVWFLETGKWAKQIDHIDGNRSNNLIQNLRDTSMRQNSQNQERHRTGKLVGATWRKTLSKWESRIFVNGKLKSLGLFRTEKEAHERYKAALLVIS